MANFNYVEFLLSDRLRDVIFNPSSPEGLIFESSSPSITIRVRPTEPRGFDELEAKVYGRCDVSIEDFEFISRVIGEQKLGVGFGFKFDALPPGVQEICREVRSKFATHLNRFIHLLRWQQRIDSPHEILNSAPSLYWKTDGDDYYAIGPRIRIGNGAYRAGVRWDPVKKENSLISG